MLDFNFIKEQTLSLDIPINHHYLDRYIKFIISVPEMTKEEGYGEIHHVLPSSLFPQFKKKTDAPWNLKRISARAHYLCHWMLWRALINNRQMAAGFWGMCNQKKEQRNIKVGSRIYNVMREDFAAYISKHNSRPDVVARSTKLYKEYRELPEIKEKYRLAMSGDKNPAKRPEVRAKMSESNKIWAENNRDKLSERILKAHRDNPDLGRMQGEKLAEFYVNNPEAVKNQSEKRKAWHNNPENEEKKKNAFKKRLHWSWGRNVAVWGKADEFYNKWIELDRPKLKTFAKLIKYEGPDHKIGPLVLRFRDGWIPTECEIWKSFLIALYTEEGK